MADAAEVIHVCEKGHADDHHYEDGDNLCSRCGGQTFPLKLDALARMAVEHSRVFAALDGEITRLERKAASGTSFGPKGVSEQVERLRDIHSRARWRRG